MRLLAGTSGYAFKEWKGSFYPGDLKDAGMLGYYATRYPTVEINNTFYRLPRENVLQDWASQVPESFTFAIKASQRITHFARLKPESKELLGYLLQNTTVLGDKLGPVLFQLPPNMPKDLERLKTFLDFLPRGRTQRHISRDSDDLGRRVLGQGRSSRLQIYAESAATDHALQAP